MRRPGLQARIALLAAAAAATAVVLASVVIYVVEGREFRAGVDADLRDRASAVAVELLGSGEESGLGDTGGGVLPAYAQVVRPDGSVVPLGGSAMPLPVDDGVRAVAAGESGRFYADAEAAAGPVRVLTVPLPGGALQLAQPAEELRSDLLFLGGLLVAVCLGSLGVAAVLGLLVARASLRPVRRLSAGAERIAATRDLSTRLSVPEDDELRRLALTLNEMLSALEASSRSQAQLVTDASHELRTPLASMRANLEVLEQSEQLDPDDRARLLDDLRTELESLVSTVDDLLHLARHPDALDQVEPLRLDLLVAESVAWARRRSPRSEIRVGPLAPVEVNGRREDVLRAIGNLLDNALKWSPPGAAVDVALTEEALTVRDRGPGIAPEDLPHVFERFYRAPASRALPGAGLGLAIVRQVADQYGWSVSAAPAQGTGSVFRVDFRPDPQTDPRHPSDTSHPPAVPLPRGGEQARPRRNRAISLALVLVSAGSVPLVAAAGLARLSDDGARNLPVARSGVLAHDTGRYTVDDALLDFGPAWYLDTARARYDYDGDGSAQLLARELGGLVGERITVETDGGRFNEDVYVLNGLPLRSPAGELPEPAGREPTPPTRPPSTGPTTDSSGRLTAELRRCDGAWCAGSTELDLGPTWYRTTVRSPHDYDGDGRRCAIETELEGLAGREVDLQLVPGDEDVLSLAGHRYRDPGERAPWAGGPLRPDRPTAAC